MKIKGRLLSAAVALLVICCATLAVLDAHVGARSTSTNNIQGQEGASAEPQRISVEELRALMDAGKVVVVDVRNQSIYDEGHIKGARLIPLDQIPSRAGELPKDKQIVTYCS